MSEQSQDSRPSEEPPVVSRVVWQGLDAERRSGRTNMLDRPVVAQLARAFGYSETAQWIEVNPRAFAEGVFRGFTVTDECSENDK